ncbi:type II toxin-antitoxin system VapC family toxin [Candidatus Pacearchaeota archaeon]|nr:type II toxin-antitoxin system VapC family toxin [Candidatus Pacearchaeota archaeon]
MEDTLLIDTDVLVDLLRNKYEIINWFKDNNDKFKFATTIINIFELYTGAYRSNNEDKEIKNVQDIIDRFIIFNLSLESVEEAGKQRARLEKQGHPLESRDIFIGSIAVTHNLPLKTNNKKHFERIEGLNLT